jgi:hypothetical protein
VILPEKAVFLVRSFFQIFEGSKEVSKYTF